jgi:OmpA-OmpF porin, OOP family
MIDDGLNSAQIAIEGHGFHDPLVATGPGVREPQNRRAVIDLGNATVSENRPLSRHHVSAM